jgi:hypothetical protein
LNQKNQDRKAFGCYFSAHRMARPSVSPAIGRQHRAHSCWQTLVVEPRDVGKSPSWLGVQLRGRALAERARGPGSSLALQKGRKERKAILSLPCPEVLLKYFIHSWKHIVLWLCIRCHRVFCDPSSDQRHSTCPREGIKISRHSAYGILKATLDRTSRAVKKGQNCFQQPMRAGWGTSRK